VNCERFSGGSSSGPTINYNPTSWLVDCGGQKELTPIFYRNSIKF
jgi:hypothetical protein